MDIAGGIFASKLAQGRTVTVAIHGMAFRKPVYVGDVISVHTDLIKVGNTSVSVHVEAWVQRRQPDRCHPCDGRELYLCRNRRCRPSAAGRPRLQVLLPPAEGRSDQHIPPRQDFTSHLRLGAKSAAADVGHRARGARGGRRVVGCRSVHRRPDWAKLLATPRRNFRRGAGLPRRARSSELCAMLDDWKINWECATCRPKSGASSSRTAFSA